MPASGTETPRSVVSTGVAGLDDVMAGGFTRGRLFLVEGVPGSGKTTLALQYLMAAARRGERVLYVTLSETTNELRAGAESHGWVLDGIEIRELTPPEEALEPDEQKPDVVVDISSVMEKKLDALGIMVSQFAEGGANGYEGLMPADPEGQKRRHREVRDSMTRRNQSLADRFRTNLVDYYGQKGRDVKFAEAFELCEYGSQPSKTDLKRLFPFFEK